MRLSVDSTENLRTSLLMTLHACQLPKVVTNHRFRLKCLNHQLLRHFLSNHNNYDSILYHNDSTSNIHGLRQIDL